MIVWLRLLTDQYVKNLAVGYERIGHQYSFNIGHCDAQM